MKALHLQLGIVVAGLLLTAGPALAQRPEPGAGASGARTGGGGGGGDTAVARGGGESVTTSSAGSGSSTTTTTSSGGGGFSSPSSASVMAPSIGAGDRAFRAAAPEHRVNYSDGNAAPRAHSAGGDQRTAPRGEGRAAPRAEGSSAPRNPDHAVTRGPASGGNAAEHRAGESAPNNASGAREVPNWSRPRGDRPATDTAVQRVGPRPDRDHGGYNSGGYYYDPYYYGGFGYNLGFGFYDRNFYGYPFYSPFGFGYGIPYGGYFDPFYGDPYDYGAGYGAYSSRVYGGQDQGSLKLKVKPRQAKVYVDGYYVGLVDEFDGAFQKLTLNGGRHKVELRAEGYETTEFDVLITPEQTVTFSGEMKKVQ